MKKVIVSLLVAGLSVAGVTTSNSTQTFANCTELNKAHKFGVGLEGAQNMVKGKPKTSKHLVDVALYEANKKKLDRDKDGIACEK